MFFFIMIMGNFVYIILKIVYPKIISYKINFFETLIICFLDNFLTFFVLVKIVLFTCAFLKKKYMKIISVKTHIN